MIPKKIKICVISFDNWNYDKEIVMALNRRNIVATHINFGKYKHKTIFERLENTFSKVFFNKNPKHFKRQDQIIEKLKNLGVQDQILVLNPDLIDLEYHYLIKKQTKRYIAYLYDSVTRSMLPIEHLLKGIFDTIYSFDKEDAEKHNFIKTNNYIYSKKQPIEVNEIFETQVLNISSFDKRFATLNRIANKLSDLNLNFTFILVSKNIKFKLLNYNLKRFFDKNKYQRINPKIKFQSKKISLKNLKRYYQKTLVMLDLVQENQTGLSFRIFESLSLQKKIITDNVTIKEYSFYNPNNILVLDSENLDLDISFFEKPYEPIDEKIYNDYTINAWVEKIFELEK